MASYDTQTITTNNYATTGGGSADFPAATSYSVRFDEGSQNNLILTGFEVGGQAFNFVLLADVINLERVNNVNATGSLHIVLYEDYSVTGTNVALRPNFARTMMESLRGSIVNRGADNVFANAGDGNGNNNNIERIDYIFPDGFPVFNNIDQRGFLVMDRGGNDRFKIAAITALNSSGKPAAFKNPVSVLDTQWGDSGISLDTTVMRGYTEGGDVLHPSAVITPQPLSGVYVTWQDLGLQTNDYIYGYSLAANDVSTNGAAWTNVTNSTVFPTNTTTDSAYGGLDLISGGMMFFEEDLNVAIGDYVWDDWNGNGLQDAGEPGLTNVLVQVYDNHTNLAAVTRTDATGGWLAKGIGPGTFFVQFTLPSGYQFSPANAGTNAAIDSNAATNTGRTESTVLGTGQTNRTVDAGMHLAPGDLRITKTASTNRATLGENVVFTLAVTNVGAQTVNLIQVTEALPPVLLYKGYGATTGTYSESTGIWALGTLVPGATATLVVTGTVQAGFGSGWTTNAVVISRMDRPDTNLADNAASAAFYVPSADLGVGKSANRSQIAEGESVTFTVAVTNFGPDGATGIALTDLLPAGLTSVSNWPSQGTYSATTGVWTVGALTNGGVATLGITAVAAAGSGGSTVTNVAVVTASSHNDPVTTNNQALAAVVIQGSDLVVTKTVDKPAASEGDTVIFTVAVENLGPSDTTGVTLSDPLPAGLTYISNLTSQGSYTATTGVWSVGALVLGGTATLQVSATVAPGTMGAILTNAAVLTATDRPDRNSANNTGAATVAVSYLQIDKTSDVVGSVLPGEEITYTIVVSNAGPTAHTDLAVVDPVPDGTTFVPGSVTVTRWPAVPQVQTTLTYAASSSFTVPAGVTNVTVAGWGGGGGGATRTSNGGGGGGGGGAYSRADVAVYPGSNYTVVVGAGGAASTAGGDSWFSLGSATGVLARGGSGGVLNSATGAAGGTAANGLGTVRYDGGNGANGVAGSYGGGGGSSAGTNAAGTSATTATGATAPAGGGNGGDGKTTPQGNGSPGSTPGGAGGGGLRLYNGTRTGGAGADGQLVVSYDIPDDTAGVSGDPPDLASGWELATGQVLQVSYTVTVDNPAVVTQIVNTASVTSAVQVVPLADSVVDSLQATDLGVFKSVDNSHPAEAETVVYTIVVTNLGPAEATGVAIADLLPAGIVLLTNSTSQGTYATNSGIWTVGTVAVGGSAVLQLSATTGTGTAGTTITNVAALTAAGIADSNSANDSDTAVIQVVGVDIGLGKSVAPAVPYEKEDVIYTITVTNFGPDAATGIVVTDALPAGLTYVSHAASQGTYAAASGIWSLGALAVSQVATLEVEAVVRTNTAGRTITNVAALAAVDQQETNPANNSAAVLVVPETAPLDIFKSVSPTNTVLGGDTLTYTIVVTNIGSQVQSNVTVTDVLPAGAIYTAGSLSLTAPVVSTQTFLDRFSTRVWTNNNGTTNWTSGWTESEGDGATAGNVQVLFDTVRGASYSLRMAGAAQTLVRLANLSGATGATLSFDYRRDGLEAGEYVAVSMSSNGASGPWTEVGRFSGAATDTNYTFFSTNVAAYISAATAVRFSTAAGMDVSDIVWFDDVQLAGQWRRPGVGTGGAPPDLISNMVLQPGEFVLCTFAVTVDAQNATTQLLNTATVTSATMTQPRTATATSAVQRNWATIGDRVWLDIDRDGIQDPGETNGVANVPVALMSTNGVAITSVVTSAEGLFLFNHVAYGTYYLRFNLSGISTNILLSPVDQGGDDAADSDVPYGGTGGYAWTTNFSVSWGMTNLTIDLGLALPNSTRAELAEIWGEWRDGAGSVVWRTASEFDTAGFRVYRVDPDTGAEELLNETLVPSAMQEDGADYALTDPAAEEGSTGTYRLEEAELTGGTVDHGTHEIQFAPARAAARPPRAAQAIAPRDLAPAKLAGPSPVLKVQFQKEGLYGVSLQDIADGLGLTLADVQALAAGNQLVFSEQGAAVPVICDSANSRMVFHGQPTDNWYTRDNVLLIEAGEGVQMTHREPGAGGGETVFPVQERFEEDLAVGNATMTELPEDWYYWKLVTASVYPASNRVDFAFTLQDYAGGPVKLAVDVLGWTRTDRVPDHRAEFLVNGVAVGALEFDDQQAATAVLEIPEGVAADGANTLTVRGALQQTSDYSYFAVDGFTASYNRRLAPGAGTIHFRAGEAAGVSAAAFTEPLAVALDNSGVPAWIADENGELPAKAWAAAGNERFAVVEAAELPMLAPEAATADAWFLAATNQIDYLVVASRALASAAQELADYRAGQGLRTGVAVFEDACDLLTGGLRTPEAVPALLTYAQTKWAAAPWLVVLAGNGNYDYLGVKSNEVNHIPPLLLATKDGIFAADGRLADTDGDGLPDVALGRLPARNATDLTAMIAKIKAYETDFGAAWQGKIVLANDIDDPAAGAFAAASGQLADLMQPPQYVPEQIDLNKATPTAARASLLNWFKNGAGFIHYTGHGGAKNWSAKNLLKDTDVNTMVNTPKPVVVALTCLAGRFEMPGVDNLGEVLLQRATGGAVAVWSPSGLSRNAPAVELGTAFYRAILHAGCGTLGLATTQARRALQSDAFSQDTLSVYNLLGDPALRIAGKLAGQSTDASFAEWRWQRFTPAELADPEISGSTGANIMEYAFAGVGVIETESTSGGGSGTGADGFVVQWKRRIQRNDVEYRLFVSEDLQTWEAGGEDLQELGATAEPDGVMEVVRTNIRRPNAMHVFVGIRAWQK